MTVDWIGDTERMMATDGEWEWSRADDIKAGLVVGIALLMLVAGILGFVYLTDHIHLMVYVR